MVLRILDILYNDRKKILSFVVRVRQYSQNVQNEVDK